MSETNSHTHHSSGSHASVQKSTTLNRRYVRRPHTFVHSTRVASACPTVAHTPVSVRPASPHKAQPATTTSVSQATNSDFIGRFIASAHSISTENSSGDNKPRPVATTSNKKVVPSTTRTIAIDTPKPSNATAQSISASSPESVCPPANDFQAAVHRRISAQRYRRSASVQTTDFDPAESVEPKTTNTIAKTAEPIERKSTSPSGNSITPSRSHLTQESPANGVDTRALTQAIHAIAYGDTPKDKSAEASTKKITKVKRSGGGKRFVLAFSAACACVAALAFFVHLNMPDVSLRVAAMQTGIEASYPSYVPRDFQMTSVYTEEEGRVVLEFTGPKDQKYTISEEKSSWDTNALLNNFVKEYWGDDYSAIREQGITIYVSNSNAVWVNGGILYHISTSSNTLTKKQMKNIAVSL